MLKHFLNFVHNATVLLCFDAYNIGYTLRCFKSFMRKECGAPGNTQGRLMCKVGAQETICCWLPSVENSPKFEFVLH